MADTSTDTESSEILTPRAPGLAALSDALLAALEGLSVAVITTDNTETNVFLREFRELIPEDLPHQVRLTAGDQCLRFPHGGTVYFYSTRQSLRGHALDRVYATEWRAQEKYMPNVCHRPGGEVLLY